MVSRFQIKFLEYAFLLNNSWDTLGVGKVCLLGTRQISSALSHGIYTNGGIALRVKGVPRDSRLEMMMGPEWVTWTFGAMRVHTVALLCPTLLLSFP